MLATLLETVAFRLRTYKLWNVVDDSSGHVAGSPKMVQVVTSEAARLQVEALAALQCRGRPAAGQATASFRCQGAPGRREERNVPGCSGRQGPHTRNLTLYGSNAGVLWGSEVLGFSPTLLKVVRADAAKTTCRLSRGQMSIKNSA